MDRVGLEVVVRVHRVVRMMVARLAVTVMRILTLLIPKSCWRSSVCLLKLTHVVMFQLSSQRRPLGLE